MREIIDSKTESEEVKSVKPSWIKMKKEDLEKIVVDLVKEGKTPAQIGLVLRDKHGVPKAKLLGKGIREILDDKKIAYRSDKEMIENRVERLKPHIQKNKKDYPASRALTKKLWVLHKLEK